MLYFSNSLDSNIKSTKLTNLICLLGTKSTHKYYSNSQTQFVFFINYPGNKNKKLKLAEMNVNKLKINFQTELIINGLKWKVKKIEQLIEPNSISHKSSSYRYEILVEKPNPKLN